MPDTPTQDQVAALLYADEPDYDRFARMGPDVLPHLRELAAGPSLELATKAAYAVAAVGLADAAAVLRDVAGDDRPEVRLAAAGAARMLGPEDAAQVLRPLLADVEVPV